MHPRYVSGLRLAALAAVLWIVAALAGGLDTWTVLSLATIAIGFLISAAGDRSERAAVIPIGFLTVAVGVTLFYRGDLWSSVYNVAGLLFAAGAVVAAGGAWRGSVLPQQAGLAVAGLASLIWVYADLGAWWWQPGNVLMVGACATAAWGAGRPQRS